jgi:serine/threonine-protein kinase RsbW
MFEEMTEDYQLDTEQVTQTRVALPDLRSFPSSPFVGLRHTLPSDVNLISSFVDQLMRFISRFRTAEEENVEIELAIREALANAVVHGNQENPQKRVYVNCRCTLDGRVSIRIEDEGDGFEHSTVPDPTSPANRLRTHGRGIYLIRTLMDEVEFEQGGSVVHIRKTGNAASGSTRKSQ